jgi:hypothetical protein
MVGSSVSGPPIGPTEHAAHAARAAKQTTRAAAHTALRQRGKVGLDGGLIRGDQ